jgi:succinoglycan biosynthesis transport protein ExoP
MLFGKKSKSAAAPAPAVAPISIAAPPPAAGEPDMRALGQALWAKKNRILTFTLLAAVAAFAVVSVITPRYRSEARLLLEARENVFLRAEADKNASDRTNIDAEAVASQTQVVLSRDLAREVIKQEKLVDVPEFDPLAGGASTLRIVLGLFGIGRDPGTMSKEERTLESFYNRLNVYAVEKSRVIAIDFSSADPKLAARVANAVAETYLKMQQASKQDQTHAAGDWLAGEIAKLRTKVADAEAKVEQYRAKTNLYVGTNNTLLPNQQLTEINSQISVARGQKADLEARARQLRQVVRSGKPIESSDIANSESMRRLIEQRNLLRSQLAEQATTLLPKHPRIMELKAQIAEVEGEMRSEGERLARQLDNDAKVAGNRLDALTASIDTVKKLASQTNEQDVQLRALEREAKTERSLLESYLAKYREAIARDNINAAPPEARIISRASPAIKPDYPKKLATVLVAAFAAFALSAGFTVTGVLLAAPSSYGFMAAEQGAATIAAAAMGAPTMPRVTSPPLTPPAPSGPAPAPAALAVSTVQQVAQSLKQAGDAGRRIAVVGAMRNAGTTYAAISLARALASDRSVVLVDLAFGAPNLPVISSDPNAPGIAELVRGNASFGDIITRDQQSPLHLVATGNVGNDASTLAASPMLATTIEALARSYDHVVLDIGSAADIALERLAVFATRAVLVSADPASPATRAARERVMLAGFVNVTLLAGVPQAAAA